MEDIPVTLHPDTVLRDMLGYATDDDTQSVTTATPELTPTSTTPTPGSRPARRVLALPGSLRRESYNRLLLRAAAERAPEGLSISIYGDLTDIPVYNEDLRDDTGSVPEPVRRLRDALAAADALLIATPEYNQSIPGAVKNLIDWLSVGTPDRVLTGKPIAVIGASTGAWGTRLAQAAVRQTLAACECLVLPGPAVFVREAAALFDAEGHLVDERAGQVLDTMLVAFAEWINRVAPVRRGDSHAASHIAVSNGNAA